MYDLAAPVWVQAMRPVLARKCRECWGQDNVACRKCALLVCYPGLHEYNGDDDTNRETTGEDPGLRKITW